MQYHLKFPESSIKKYDAISSKVIGVIDVTRAPKFLGALKVVPKLVASDQKIGRSWMLQMTNLNVPQSVAHLIFVPQVPQMWHKMWHNSIYILSTNQYISMKIVGFGGGSP